MRNTLKEFVATLEQFADDRRGNIAVIFGIATLPIIGAVGAAVDYSHAHAVKAAMQSAADSTALMLARDASALGQTDLDAKAKSYFKTMFTREEARNVTVSASYSANSGSQVLVAAAAEVPTYIMSIAGYNHMTITAEATAKWGTERLRVALALDVTGSMAASGKMTALKGATKSLLNQLKAAASSNGDVYVSIIPFNKDVNVGPWNYNANWIDWSAFDASSSGSTSMSGTICWGGTLWNIDSSGWHNAGSCNKNGGSICAMGILWKYNGSWYNAGSCNHMAWNGCVTDRGDANAPIVTITIGRRPRPSLRLKLHCGLPSSMEAVQNRCWA